MKINFKAMDLGEKLIIIASVISLVSLFMPWAHKIFDNRNAFYEGEFLLFIPYLYPLIVVFRGKVINKIIGSIAAIIPIVLVILLLIVYTGDRYQTPLIGMYIFLISSILLLVGVILCKANIS